MSAGRQLEDPMPDTAAQTSVAEEEDSGPELVEDELLVEEISIDGMCGVY